jgi:hypothetical protein
MATQAWLSRTKTAAATAPCLLPPVQAASRCARAPHSADVRSLTTGLHTAHCGAAAASAATAAALLSRHTALWPAQLLRWHPALHQRSGPRQPVQTLSGRVRDPRAPQTVHSLGKGPEATVPGPCSGGRRSALSASAMVVATWPSHGPAAAAASSAASAPAATSASRPHACRARSLTASATSPSATASLLAAGRAATCGMGGGVGIGTGLTRDRWARLMRAGSSCFGGVGACETKS